MTSAEIDSGFDAIRVIIGLSNLFLTTFLILGTVLEFLCLILFINHFIRKTEHFLTGFFYILTTGYFIDITSVLFVVAAIVGHHRHQTTLDDIASIVMWYATLLLGPWNTLMALNRFTAVKYWQSHSRYWTGWPLVGLIGVLLVYPFVVNGYVFSDPHCVMNPKDANCSAATRDARFAEFISNSANILVAAFLGYSTTVATRLNIITLTPETKKFERFLLFSSIVSTIFFFGNLLKVLFVGLVDPDPLPYSNLGQLLMLLAQCYQSYFHLSATVLLFFVS